MLLLPPGLPLLGGLVLVLEAGLHVGREAAAVGVRVQPALGLLLQLATNLEMEKFRKHEILVD